MTDSGCSDLTLRDHRRREMSWMFLCNRNYQLFRCVSLQKRLFLVSLVYLKSGFKSPLLQLTFYSVKEWPICHVTCGQYYFVNERMFGDLLCSRYDGVNLFLSSKVYYQLMHKRIALKGVLKFTLNLTPLTWRICWAPKGVFTHSMPRPCRSLIRTCHAAPMPFVNSHMPCRSHAVR